MTETHTQPSQHELARTIVAVREKAIFHLEMAREAHDLEAVRDWERSIERVDIMISNFGVKQYLD